MSAFKFSPDSIFCGTNCLSVATLCRRTEVVLAILLTNFAFELTDEPIVWNSSDVIYPTMREESTHPEMLLKVKLL